MRSGLRNWILVVSLTSIMCIGCASWFEPEFVKEENKKTEDFQKAHPTSSANTKFGDRNIHYVHIGTQGKPKIIFVHGSPGGWGAWVRQLNDESFYPNAFMIAADRLGYGGSDPGHTERSLDQQAQAMMTLLDVDDPSQPVILVGHSYGGPVVVRMAMTADPRIKAVVILAGSVDPDLEPYEWYQTPADWAIFRWMIPTALVTCNQEITALKSELIRVMPLWDQIQSHVTVIQGTKDNLVDPKNADFIEKKLSRLKPEIIRVPGMNHFIPSGCMDLVHQTLESQLTGIGPK